MSRLEKNLEFFNKMGFPIHRDLLAETPFSINEKVKPLKTADGFFTLQVETGDGEKVLLHSAYSPQREAKRFVGSLGLREGMTVILFGLGLGYQLQEILR